MAKPSKENIAVIIRKLEEIKFLSSIKEPTEEQESRLKTLRAELSKQFKAKNLSKLEERFTLAKLKKEYPNATQFETRIRCDIIAKEGVGSNKYETISFGVGKRLGIYSIIEALTAMRNAYFDAVSSLSGDFFTEGIFTKPWGGKVRIKTFQAGSLARRAIDFLEILDTLLQMPKMSEFDNFLGRKMTETQAVFIGHITITWNEVREFVKETKFQNKILKQRKEKRFKIQGLSARVIRFGPDTFIYENKE